MTSLPITPNIAPAPAGNKPPSGDDSAATGEQAFGAVLARQFADAAGANTAKLGLALGKFGDAVGKAGKDAPDTGDAASNIPADMLASLLAQHAVVKDAATPTRDAAAVPDDAQAVLAQQQAALAATGVAQAAPVIAQPVRSGEPAADDSSPLSARALPGNGAAAPRQAEAMPAAAASAQDKGVFGEALQALDKKTVAVAASDAPHGHHLAELPAAVTAAVSAPLTGNQASSAPVSPLSIDTAVGQTGWDRELGQKITWIASQRDQSAELHLNPPQLGPLDVVLKVSGDQATAMFTSPHAAVRDAIEQALPKLREMLADSGIMLGNATVNDQTARKEQDNFARPQYDNAGPAGITVSDHQAGSTTTTVGRHNGLVDTFA